MLFDLTGQCLLKGTFKNAVQYGIFHQLIIVDMDLFGQAVVR